jgi:hypothetical protein
MDFSFLLMGKCLSNAKQEKLFSIFCHDILCKQKSGISIYISKKGEIVVLSLHRHLQILHKTLVSLLEWKIEMKILLQSALLNLPRTNTRPRRKEENLPRKKSFLLIKTHRDGMKAGKAWA